MKSAKTSVKVIAKTRLLTAAEFQRLADVPPEIEWFRNIRNSHTKRAYENAIKDFMLFTGIAAGGIPRRDPRACHRLARRSWRPTW